VSKRLLLYLSDAGELALKLPGFSFISATKPGLSSNSCLSSGCLPR
jgi:hypothetical protein